MLEHAQVRILGFAPLLRHSSMFFGGRDCFTAGCTEPRVLHQIDGMETLAPPLTYRMTLDESPHLSWTQFLPL